MVRAKKQFRYMFFTIIFTMIFVCPIFAKKTEWLIFNNSIPSDAKRYDIKMRFVPADSTFYETSLNDVHSAATKEEKDYRYLIAFDKAVDQKQYSVLLNNADLNFLGRNDEHLCKARIISSADKGKPETLGEGYLFFNREFEIPVEIFGSQLYLPTNETVKGYITINIYNNNSSYSGNIRTHLKGALSGSAADANGTLAVSMQCGKSVKLEDRTINLSFQSYEGKTQPVSGRGAISDTISLDKTKLVVEKIASDNSEIVLAVVSGELTASTVAAANKETLIAGKPFPTFNRIDLLQRRIISLEDMKNKSGAGGFVVLIFGNFKNTIPNDIRGFPGRFGDDAACYLALDEAVITDILSNDVNVPVTIGFVCDQLSLSNFYEKWLGRNIEFYLLSDYSNPMNINFIVSRPNFGHYPPMDMNRSDTKNETLREQLGFPKNKVVTALIDGKGNLTYINTDACSELSETLLQINKMMKAK